MQNTKVAKNATRHKNDVSVQFLQTTPRPRSAPAHRRTKHHCGFALTRSAVRYTVPRLLFVTPLPAPGPKCALKRGDVVSLVDSTGFKPSNGMSPMNPI